MAKRKKIRNLVKYWQEKFLLNRWRIRVRFNDDEAWDRSAEVAMTPGLEEADIRVSELEKNLSELVVHEMCHLAMEPLETVSSQWLTRLSQEDQRLYQLQYQQAEHRVIDHFTQVIKMKN